MPTYRFKNKKSGKIYEKFMTLEERDRYVNDKNIEQIPTGFKIANLIGADENKLRESIWNMAQRGKKASYWKDNRR